MGATGQKSVEKFLHMKTRNGFFRGLNQNGKDIPSATKQCSTFSSPTLNMELLAVKVGGISFG